jgi:hypothetical protein
MTMADAPDFVVELAPKGSRDLVITGPWSAEAAEVLIRGEADGLVLTRARGIREGTLDLLDSNWALGRLKLTTSVF